MSGNELTHESGSAGSLYRSTWNLTSVFQPVVSLNHSRVVGHEAFLRGNDPRKRAATAPRLLAELSASLAPLEVEKLCVNLHLSNFVTRSGDGWLILRLHPSNITATSEFIEFLNQSFALTGTSPHQAVFVISEPWNSTDKQLTTLSRALKEFGSLVALEEFGTGRTTFDHAVQVRPNLVRLSRGLLQASRNPSSRTLLSGFSNLLHDTGSLLILDGIETDEHALRAMECNIDFVQGPRFSKAVPDLLDAASLRKLFLTLGKKAESRLETRHRHEQEFLQPYSGCFRQAARALSAGTELTSAVSGLLRLAGLDRVYLLDAQGAQIGSNLESKMKAADDPRFAPCADTETANWFRRPYFQRALARPATLQVSRPYRSVRDGKRCVTLSMSLTTSNGLRVLCADVGYHDEEAPLPSSAANT